MTDTLMHCGLMLAVGAAATALVVYAICVSVVGTRLIVLAMLDRRWR
jgi:hypothetical protein